MRFVDYVIITVRSGRGGPGCVAFRREKFVPRGGPAGGNGGRGGSVFLDADANLHTLLDLRYRRHQYAPSGGGGEGSLKSGKDGGDLILRVPPGTQASLTDGGERLGEVLEPGGLLLLARGGRGGKGNAHFKTATRQTPRYAQPGEPAVEKRVTLELKLLADVGLVGLPNAGKSTLVASVSAARPKIADYPFTTLVPSLGVVDAGDYRSFVIADIPGIVEGAHDGLGLGIRFLKHIERNAVLLFVIPVTSEDPRAEYELLLGELVAFNPEMAWKPRLVAFSKADLLPPAERGEWLKYNAAGLPRGVQSLLLSAVSGVGLDDAKRVLWDRIRTEEECIADA